MEIIVPVLIILGCLVIFLMGYALGLWKSNQLRDHEHYKEISRIHKERRVVLVCRSESAAVNTRRQLGSMTTVIPIAPDAGNLTGITTPVVMFAPDVQVTAELQRAANTRVAHYGPEGRVVYL